MAVPSGLSGRHRITRVMDLRPASEDFALIETVPDEPDCWIEVANDQLLTPAGCFSISSWSRPDSLTGVVEINLGGEWQGVCLAVPGGPYRSGTWSIAFHFLTGRQLNYFFEPDQGKMGRI